jgi:hypothetical protein
VGRGRAGRGKAARAERDARIYALALAGRTERQIAAEVRLSLGRVHAIINEEIGRRVGPLAEGYAARREAELSELWSRAFAILTDAGSDADTRLKAVDRLVKINESRRRLRGADAPVAMAVQLEHRVDEETAVVVEALMAGLKAVSLSPDRQAYALEAAGARLKALEGGDSAYVEPAPMPPAGPSAAPYVADGSLYIDGPDGLRYRVVAEVRQPAPTVEQDDWSPEQPSGADKVADVLAAFEREFGSLDDDEEDGTGGTETEGA